MIPKVFASKTEYVLLKKHRFSLCNTIFVLVVFFLIITTASLLSYNFFKIAIAKKKLIENSEIPTWINWIWDDSTASEYTNFSSTLKKLFYNQIIVCYYTVPSLKNETTVLLPNSIDPNLCTHIIIGFAEVVNSSLYIKRSNLFIFKSMQQLKYQNPNLKIMLSVGGASTDSYGFQEMVKNHANRKSFIRSVLNITKYLQLDGLDLDWEFPAWAEGNRGEMEKVHFVQLVQELRKEFDHSKQNLILSAAVAAPQAIIDESYFVPELAEHIDFVNLMSYDYHFFLKYFPVTGLNAPLYPQLMEKGYLTTLNVNYSANYWISKGMPREKIVIGIPLYGHSYKLFNSENHGLQAPSSGFGDIGTSGFVNYMEVCKFLNSGGIRVFVNESCVPYAYKILEWISYDDETSVTYKSKWIKDNKFKGAMVFSLNVDDWNYTCSRNQRFPLTNVVKKIFNF